LLCFMFGKRLFPTLFARPLTDDKERLL
jgi:hypothetical protein